jgi:hypothetical protein
MASTRQVQAAKRNVKKAQGAATRKRTIAKLPKRTRSELGKQAARGRQRGGEAGRALEDRNRQQLYEIAKDRNISGPVEDGEVGSDQGDSQEPLIAPTPVTTVQSRPNGRSPARPTVGALTYTGTR